MGMQAELIQRVISRKEEYDRSVQERDKLTEDCKRMSRALDQAYAELRAAMMPDSVVTYGDFAAVRYGDNIRVILAEKAT